MASDGGTRLLRFFLTKSDRLLKRGEFLRVSIEGKTLQNDHFIAVYSPSLLGRTRLGITVTRKVGKAAARNRIKRFIREFFRLNRHRITGDRDIHIIAKKEAANLTHRQMDDSLKDIFAKLPG